jgi:hypothetical protein
MMRILWLVLMSCPVVLHADWATALERNKDLPLHMRVVDLTMREYARCLVRAVDDLKTDPRLLLEDNTFWRYFCETIDCIILFAAPIVMNMADVLDIIIDAILRPRW